MKNYLKRTWKNKVAAVMLMAVGYISMMLDGDGTALVLLTMLSMPLFFARENYIVRSKGENTDEKVDADVVPCKSQDKYGK